MSKKSFTDVENPALAYITSYKENSTEPEEPKEVKKEVKHIPTPKRNNTPIKGKAEAKTKHLHLIIKPTVYEDVSQLAGMKRTSLNNLVSDLLEDYIETNRGKLEAYKKILEQ